MVFIMTRSSKNEHPILTRLIILAAIASYGLLVFDAARGCVGVCGGSYMPFSFILSSVGAFLSLKIGRPGLFALHGVLVVLIVWFVLKRMFLPYI
jgi:hypothetical protein